MVFRGILPDFIIKAIIAHADHAEIRIGDHQRIAEDLGPQRIDKLFHGRLADHRFK